MSDTPKYAPMTGQIIWDMVQRYEGKPPSRLPTIDELCESLKKNGLPPVPPILRMAPKRVKF